MPQKKVRKLARPVGPQYFICDSCGRTYNMTQLNEKTGNCVNCPKTSTVTGRARGILSMNADGRVMVLSPMDAKNRPIPKAEDITAQEGNAEAMAQVNRGR